MSKSLVILALSDAHFAERSHPEDKGHGFPCHLGLEWIDRAINEACRLQRPDIIVLMGDMLDNGDAAGAEYDMASIAALIKETHVPVIVAPGNHDGPAQRMMELFDDRPGLHHSNGYAIYSFADPYAADGKMTRPDDETQRFLETSISEPLIVLQHSPIYPDVSNDKWPFMPENVQAIRDSYRRKHVLLSISGHYHAGQEAATLDGTTYVTCAALIDAPFCFDIIRIDDCRVVSARHRLKLPDAARVTDVHTHSHFGYCAVNVHPKPTLERAQLLGAQRVVCLEHAGQLYLTEEQFWSRTHIDDVESLRRARAQGKDRLRAFRAEMNKFRSEQILVGLELEMDAKGKLTLLEEDGEGWDVLLGAVHWLPNRSEATVEAFVDLTERLIESEIDILAHPLRYAFQKRLELRSRDYDRIVSALKKRCVAAEINYHHSGTDVEFYRRCAQESIPLVFGSDAHMLKEVCDMSQHLRLLDAIGLSNDCIADPMTVGRYARRKRNQR